MNKLLSSANRFTRQALAAGILCAVALMSCKKDDGPRAALPGDKVQTTFKLAITPQQQEFQTYEDIGIEEPKTILYNIWVLEFDSLGRNLAVVSVPEQIVGNDMTVSLIAGKKVSVYVVANAGSATFSTDMNLKAFKKAIYNGRVTQWDALPHVGQTEIDIEWHDSRVEAPVSVTAIGAAVTVKYVLPQNSGYELLTLQLKNAPTKFYYFPGTPVTAADVEDQNIIAVTPNNLYTYTIPENLQGVDPAITSPKDKVTGKPATYLSLIGRNTTTNKRVEFRLYPGGNNTNNFDISVNTQYIMTCNVNFDDPDDKRITVLD